MIVIGGIGSISGAVFGAALTILPEALRRLDQQFPGLRMVTYALLLILTMIFRPQGLFGRREFGWSWLRQRSRDSPGGGDQVMPAALLETRAVTKRFGGLTAVKALTLKWNAAPCTDSSVPTAPERRRSSTC